MCETPVNDIKKIPSNTAPSVTYKQAYNTFDLVPILISIFIWITSEQVLHNEPISKFRTYFYEYKPRLGAGL